MKISEIVSDKDLLNIKKKGVYKISYPNSNRVYIGSTTKTFYLRWIQHLWELKKGLHKNSKIVNVVNKYGMESLIFEIVEVVNDVNKIIEREQYYIDLYNSYNEGLNCSPSALNSSGCVRSEESLKKYFYKPVYQYDIDGNFIKDFKSMKDASNMTNTDYITLSNACDSKYEKTRLANGYQWRKEFCGFKIDAVRPKSSIKIYQYDTDGNFIKEWSSIKETSNHFKRPSNSFSVAIKRGREIENYFWSKIKCDKISFKKIKNNKKEIINENNICI